MRRYLIACAVATLATSLGACATDKMRSKQKVLDDTLRSYAATIRWGDMAQAQAFIDPKLLKEHPPTALELARYKQVQVSGYDEQPAVPVGDTEVRQTVKIDLVNINTQHARSVIDHQVWRYDDEAKHWWLTSGLPDISRSE